MIHVPTMSLFILKEITYQKDSTAVKIKRELDLWKKMNHGSNNFFVHTYDTQYNNSDRKISIISDYLSGGSVKNLLESTGTLEESIIQIFSY